MRLKNYKTQMRQYTQPLLQSVRLDNEVALTLESAPPIGPEESYMVHEKTNNPFRKIDA